MHIEEDKATVRDVTEGYFNDAEESVIGSFEMIIKEVFKKDIKIKCLRR